MKNLLSAIGIAVLLSACSSEQKQESHDHGSDGGDPRTKELLAVHDSIMPAMSTIMDLKAKISNDIKTTDSLLAVKSDAALKTRRTEAQSLLKSLEEADKSMMDWMHQYKHDTISKLDDAAATAYIADQKGRIDAVRDQMKKSIETAKAYTEKSGQ